MKSVKKLLSCLLAALLLLSLFAGCAKEDPAGELVIYAAASLTEVLPKLTAKYQERRPGVSPTFNFESSGTLKTQIEEGADCDIFISAGLKQMDQLDVEADKKQNPDGLDFIDSATRFDLLENKVVLVVPKSNPKDIHSFDDLVKGLQEGAVLLAMGGPDVPVGQYTQKILEHFHLDEARLAGAGLISYGENVKAVTTQVQENLADCGIVYSTDALAAGLEVADTATKGMCGQVVYPAAMLKNARNDITARDFLEWLKSDEAGAILQTAGFSPMN